MVNLAFSATENTTENAQNTMQDMKLHGKCESHLKIPEIGLVLCVVHRMCIDGIRKLKCIK